MNHQADKGKGKAVKEMAKALDKGTSKEPLFYSASSPVPTVPPIAPPLPPPLCPRLAPPHQVTRPQDCLVIAPHLHHSDPLVSFPLFPRHWGQDWELTSTLLHWGRIQESLRWGRSSLVVWESSSCCHWSSLPRSQKW